MRQYLDLLQKIATHGNDRGDRTGTGTRSLFGEQLRFDLRQGFPLLTTKKLHWKSIVVELLWLLSGSTNVRDLQKHGVTIWDSWQGYEPEVGGPSDERPLVWIKRKSATSVDVLCTNPDEVTSQASTTEHRTRLAGVWHGMMNRCYDPEHDRYPMYGAKGVRVAAEWHNIERFMADICSLPNWRHKQLAWNEYQLDKDYYGSGVYSRETCVWLHKTENHYYTSAACPFTVKIPGAPTRTFLTLSHGESALDISRSTLHRLITGEQDPATLKGNNRKAREWRFKSIPPREDEMLRMAFSRGELGPVYGQQWRCWPDGHGGSLDQITAVIKSLRENPDGRRHIVSAWNVADVDQMKLPPCHLLFQFYVTVNRELSCHMYQRSADIFLGVPFNIASYALLMHIIGREVGMRPAELTISFGDVHIYKNHFEQVREQLARAPRNLPELSVQATVRSVFDHGWEDFVLHGYDPYPAIKAPVAV